MGQGIVIMTLLPWGRQQSHDHKWGRLGWCRAGGGWQHDGMDYVLAQVNIGRLREPLDSPRLAGFVAALDPVNAAADAAPGFLWRLQTEDGNATSVRAFEWDQAGSAAVI